jgi:prepilin-type N-terminal cleavage/methylation domain-containing protein/prepilin-type processing-associated H-X9-DG protein
MERVFRHSYTSAQPPRGGFTLLEVLVVVSIIALLIALLLPSLSAARETANVTRCLANLREIARTSHMYMERESAPDQPWHLGWNHGGASYGLVSEFVYGGMQSNMSHPKWGIDTDMFMVPTHLRPYNQIMAPGICEGPIPNFVCPSDTGYTTANTSNPCAPPDEGKGLSSTQVHGNSYAINWHWYEYNAWDSSRDYTNIEKISRAGRVMLRHKVGAPASRFVLFMENNMSSYTNSARPKDGSDGSSCLNSLGVGWHGKRSRYTMAFLDGHVTYQFIDPRFSSGEGYELWPEKGTRAE